jgi:hypothetical protein
MREYLDRNERCVHVPTDPICDEPNAAENDRRLTIERMHEAVDSLDSPARPATLDPPVPPIGKRGDSYKDDDMVSAMENMGLCCRTCDACYANRCYTIGDLRRVAETGEVVDWTLCGAKTLAEIEAAIKRLDARGKR